MKRKFVLIPILLTTNSLPLVSITGCGKDNRFQPQSFEFSFPYTDWQIEPRSGSEWDPYEATKIYLSEIGANPRIWAEDGARFYTTIVATGSLTLTLSNVDTTNLTMDCDIHFNANLTKNTEMHYIFKNIEFAITYKSNGQGILYPKAYFIYEVGGEDDTALANAVANLKSHRDGSITTYRVAVGQVLYDGTGNSNNVDSDASNCIKSLTDSSTTSYYLSNL